MKLEELDSLMKGFHNEEEIIFQIEKYFNTNCNNENHPDPLLYLLQGSAFRRCNKTLEYLLRKKSDINATFGSGRTLLMWASEALGGSNLQAMQILLDQKADPNMKDQHGETALHFAAGKLPVSLKAIQLLVLYGARIDIRNIYNKEAIYRVPSVEKDYCHKEIIQYLVSQGALLPLKHISEIRGELPLSLSSSEMFETFKKEGKFLPIIDYWDFVIEHMCFLLEFSKISLELLKDLELFLSEEKFKKYKDTQRDIETQIIETISGWTGCQRPSLEDIQCYLTAVEHNKNLVAQWREAAYQVGYQVLLPRPLCYLIGQYLAQPRFEAHFQHAFNTGRSLYFRSIPDLKKTKLEVIQETKVVPPLKGLKRLSNWLKKR